MVDDDRFWTVRYFQRHQEDDPDESIPGQAFLRQECPDSVTPKFFAVLVEVAKAPPHKFSGGGYWESMHGDMSGYYEVRLDGPKRTHYRLFCLLEEEPPGYDEPTLVVLCGLWKPFRTTLSDADYKAVRDFGDEYFSRTPRSLA